MAIWIIPFSISAVQAWAQVDVRDRALAGLTL